MSQAQRLDEFALIRQYFDRPATGSVAVGIGDDCAVLQLPANHQLLVSIDSLVEGVHFPVGAPADQLAWRLLGAAVSDLAAMGATPAWLTLALTLPEADRDWLAAFSEALHQAAERYSVSLVGGDTTRGPLTLTAQVHGWAPAGQALLRSGAKAGELICVSGTLGDSRAGLERILAADNSDSFLQQRYYRPTPRLELGQLLRGVASSCIDISDGLLADLNHLLVASKVGARLDLSALPMSDEMIAVAGERAQQWALSGGEDFELCFTLAADKLEQLQASADCQITAIGEVQAEPGLYQRQDGVDLPLAVAGYNHFKSEER